MRPSAIDVEPIQRERAANMIVGRLLGLVKTGGLVAGDRLPSERLLAEKFGVSRPTIREALGAMAVLGVVEIRHGEGVFVSKLSAVDLLQPLTFFLTLEDVTVEKLYAARRVIEGEIAALAASRASEQDCIALAQLIEAQKAVLTDPAQYRDVDTRFHLYLARLADNPFLERAAQSLNILGLEFRKLASETSEVLTASVLGHLAILKALREGNSQAARKAMAEHMDCVLQTTRRAMEVVDE